jgi:hypothetical protein
MKFIVNRSQNTEFAQPMIDKKMREVRNVTSHDTIQVSVSIAEELSKLFKTKRARGYNRRRIFTDEKQFNEEDVVTTPITNIIDAMRLSIRNYDCFLSSPSSNVIVFIVSHFSHFAPKSVIFQKAWGVRKFGSPHFLHVW